MWSKLQKDLAKVWVLIVLAKIAVHVGRAGSDTQNQSIKAKC
jgi:hypothetical protein